MPDTVNVGTIGNDGTGDNLRLGATKINTRFDLIQSQFDLIQSQFDAITAGVVPPSTVTNSMLTNVPQATFKGRQAGIGTGVVQDMTVAQALATLGIVTVATTGSGADLTNDTVTNAKLTNMAAATFKMREFGAGTGDPIDGTAAQALATLFSSASRIALGAKNAFGFTIAIGRNADNLAQGLQIGGGNTEDGADGVQLAPDGHANWLRFQPSKNENPLEFLLYPTSSQGRATLNSGGNTVTRVSGTNFSSAWIGKKIYLGQDVYRVATVPSASSLTVTTTGGGGVTFGSTTTVTFHVFQNTGTGTCNVTGTTVTRVSGDPFTPFFTGGDFTFQINGTTRTVSSFTNTSTLVLASAPGDVTNATYTYRFDINDALVLFRIQKLLGSDEENLSVFARYDGYWLRAQFAGAGEMYPIRLSTGETTGTPYQQIVLQTNGDLSLGGDYGSDTLRVVSRGTNIIANRIDIAGAPTTFAPAFRARGTDANVGLGFDTQGTGTVTFTSGAFSTVTFQILSTGGIQFRLAGVGNYANDAAAAAGGVAVGGMYRNGSALQIRVV